MSACKQCRFSGVSLRSGTGITAAAILIAAAIAAPLFAQTDSGLASNLAAFNAGLNGLIAEVRTNNPQLKAAGYRTEAARAAAGFQKFLDPPLLGIDFFQTPLSSFPDPIGRDAEIDYSIQQMFPFPGKLSSMASAEQSRSAMYGADAKTLEQVIIRDCKMAWFEIYLIDRRLQVNAENQGLLKSFIGITRRQYEVGRGTQADILRGQTELSTLGHCAGKSSHVPAAAVQEIFSQYVPEGQSPGTVHRIDGAWASAAGSLASGMVSSEHADRTPTTATAASITRLMVALLRPRRRHDRTA